MVACAPSNSALLTDTYASPLRAQRGAAKRDTVYSYDQVKYLGGFLWSIHARWSIIE
jgi:hypothetical protein